MLRDYGNPDPHTDRVTNRQYVALVGVVVDDVGARLCVFVCEWKRQQMESGSDSARAWLGICSTHGTSIPYEYSNRLVRVCWRWRCLRSAGAPNRIQADERSLCGSQHSMLAFSNGCNMHHVIDGFLTDVCAHSLWEF